MDDSGLLATIINALRSKAPTPSGRPLDKQARGYQLAVAEAKAQGMEPPTYEQWLETATPVGE